MSLRLYAGWPTGFPYLSSVCPCLQLLWMFSIVTQAQEMTFTDKSTAQYILDTDKHSASLNTLPLSYPCPPLPPLSLVLFIHLSSFLSPIPYTLLLLCRLQSYHLLPPIPNSNTSSVPPPASSSTTSPCVHLFPSLTLIISLPLLRSLFQL